MALPLDQLIQPLTTEQFKSSIYAALAATGTNTTNWKPGAVVRTIIAAVSIVLAALSLLVALVARGGYLLLARGAWLDLVGTNTFNEDRIDATFATGTVYLTNSGGGNYPENADAVTFVNSRTGKTYRNRDPFTLGPGVAGLAVVIRADEAGAAPSWLPGEIELQTALANVTVESPDAVTGLDAEADIVYATRCGDKLGAFSPDGPRDAYRFTAVGATRVTDGSVIGINRVKALPPTGDGFVDVYVATAAGAVPGDAADPNTDLGAVADACFKSCAPLGISPRLHSASEVSLSIAYEIWVYTSQGFTEAQITDAIAAALIDFSRTLPIGGARTTALVGYVFKDALQTLISTVTINAVPLATVHCVVSSPAADLALGSTDIISLGVVTPTVHFVAPPGG
jgi:hypothetical protein